MRYEKRRFYFKQVNIEQRQRIVGAMDGINLDNNYILLRDKGGKLQLIMM